jgi:hypothetical protein
MSKTTLALALVASLATIAVYAAPGSGYGPGYGSGACATAGAESACPRGGPGAGYGPGGGRMMGGYGAGGAGSMMTEEERAAHREKMHSFTTVEQCNAYWTEHRAQMTERAKAQGIEPGPGPRVSPCERMAQHGMLQR